MTAKKLAAKDSTLELIATVQELRRLHTVVSEAIAVTEKKLAEAPVLPTPTAGNIKAGVLFKRNGEGLGNVYIKCRPTSYILNSTLISEAMMNGKVLICNVETGSTFFIKGDEPVEIKD